MEDFYLYDRRMFGTVRRVGSQNLGSMSEELLVLFMCD